MGCECGNAYVAGCISRITCGAPWESFLWSGTAELGFRVWGVLENREGFAFSLLLFTCASLQRKALNPHGPTWMRLPVLQTACSTLSCRVITYCHDYNTKYSGIQIKMLIPARLEQQPGQTSVLPRLVFVSSLFCYGGRDSPTFYL